MKQDIDMLKFWNVVDTMWKIFNGCDGSGKELSNLIFKMSNLDRYLEDDVSHNKRFLDVLKEINEFSGRVKSDFSELQDMVNKLSDEIRGR